VNLYLPFGLCSAPYLFNEWSDALEWILKNDYNLKNIIHILDDFFIAEASRQQCLSSFSTLLRFFMSVRDSTRMEARLPEDKLLCTRALLNSFTGRRSVRLLELQSLIDTLQFACKAVIPGRTFLQHMIDLTRGVHNCFHHIRLNK